MAIPIDAEDFVRSAIERGGFASSAVPLPEDFAQDLPFVLVTRVGGTTRHETADQHSLSIDVYADTWETATNAANESVSIVRELLGAYIGGVSVYDVNCSMPYVNPNPNYEYVPRMTFTAQLTTSGKEA